jgi:penicillin-binding protein 1A
MPQPSPIAVLRTVFEAAVRWAGKTAAYFANWLRTAVRREEPPPRSRRGGWVPYLGSSLLTALFVAAAALPIWVLYGLHFPSVPEVTRPRAVVLQTADGQPLFHQGAFQLAPVAAKDLPPDVVNAVISIEDRRFYQHGAIDFYAIARALKQNFDAGNVVAGGSTITQQLVKVLLLSPQRTYRRKFQEAAIAIWLDHHLSKDEILTTYLNNVYLGAGAIGLPAAAKIYFDKDVHDLRLSEAAMLAGLIHAPSETDPLRNPDLARKRAAAVLDAMAANGKITPAQAMVAKLSPATIDFAAVAPASTGWFADWVYGKVVDATPGLGGAMQVRTTLDLRLQQIAADAVNTVLAAEGPEKHASEAALVAMRPDGAIVAMVGGRNYATSQFNRAVQARRQPGSAFKLFDYYAALRYGLSPNDEIVDAPIEVGNWEPDNYTSHYHGRVTLSDAFAHSLNAAAVRLSQQVGIDQVVAAARDLGLRGPLRKTPSLALGTSEVSLVDLTSAYAAVRAGAAPVGPWGIVAIRMPNDHHDTPVGRPNEVQHSLGPYQTELIELMRGVVEHGTGRAAALDGFAAGKTGTSQDYRDAWFVGFNDVLIVGVWVGNDNHSPMNHVAGGSLPAEIWKRFMDQSKARMKELIAAAEKPSAGPATTEKPLAAPAAVTADKPPPAPAAEIAAKPAPPAPKVLVDRAIPERDAEADNGRCNVAVCQQYYQSFRASDCTYQPYNGGERRYCGR